MAARRTTMNIDHELVEQAQGILGTETATATVHRALDEVIRRFHLERLAARDFANVDLGETQALRRPRNEQRAWAPESHDQRDAS